MPSGQGGPAPAAAASYQGGSRRTLRLALANSGRTPVRFTVTPASGHVQSAYAAPGAAVPVTVATGDGRYDVTVTTGSELTYRLAGTIEAGQPC